MTTKSKASAEAGGAFSSCASDLEMIGSSAVRVGGTNERAAPTSRRSPFGAEQSMVLERCCCVLMVTTNKLYRVRPALTSSKE